MFFSHVVLKHAVIHPSLAAIKVDSGRLWKIIEAMKGRLRKVCWNTIAIVALTASGVVSLQISASHSASCDCTETVSPISSSDSCCFKEKANCCCSKGISPNCGCESCSCKANENPIPEFPAPAPESSIKPVVVSTIGLFAESELLWPNSAESNFDPASSAINQSVSAQEKCVVLSRFNC